MTTDRLAEIQARADAATDGPWEARHRAGLDWLSQSPHVDNDGHEPGSSVGLADAVDPLWGSLWPSRNANADAEFIAHARTDVLALVAALRAVRAECGRVRQNNTGSDFRAGGIAAAGIIEHAVEAALGEAS